MREPVKQGSGETLRAHHVDPALEGQVGGDDKARSFVCPAHHVKEQLGSRLREGHVPQLVEDDKLQPVETPHVLLERPLSTPKLARACETELKVRVGLGGWKAAWRSACWARLRNGDEALKYYHDLVAGERASPNLLNAGRTFQVDANFGGGAALPEMLLQSHLRSMDSRVDTVAEAAYVPYREDPRQPNNFVAVVPPDSLANAPYILDLLPALPSAWPEGSVRGLRARGGFEVDIEWKDGQLTEATIRASRDGAFRIYARDKLSKVISLKKGQSRVWQGTK